MSLVQKSHCISSCSLTHSLNHQPTHPFTHTYINCCSTQLQIAWWSWMSWGEVPAPLMAMPLPTLCCSTSVAKWTAGCCLPRTTIPSPPSLPVTTGLPLVTWLPLWAPQVPHMSCQGVVVCPASCTVGACPAKHTKHEYKPAGRRHTDTYLNPSKAQVSCHLKTASCDFA